MNHLIFDIETAPLPEPELEIIQPHFSAPANFKDMGKIAASILEKQAAWKESAALSALSGRVLAIGWREMEGPLQVIQSDEDDEADVIRAFWNLCRDKVLNTSGRAIGFNIYQFDLPFLVRRSWRLGLRLPSELRQGRYWNSRFVDLLDLWALQDRERVSLHRLSLAFGLGGKEGEGKFFHQLWRERRSEALTYLERDLDLTRRLALAMGVLDSAHEATASERNLLDRLFNPAAVSKEEFRDE